MSLFQCENCGCCENTALTSLPIPKLYDWTYAPEREGMKLCSACSPPKYRDGSGTDIHGWHGQFERTFLPIGKFKTNRRGNLEHIETGEEDFRKYAISLEMT